MDTNALESIPYQCNSSLAQAPSGHPPGERDKRVSGWFHYNSGKATNHPEVRTLPKCAFCDDELVPPVRTPHTGYVKTLYRVGGQGYPHCLIQKCYRNSSTWGPTPTSANSGITGSSAMGSPAAA